MSNYPLQVKRPRASITRLELREKFLKIVTDNPYKYTGAEIREMINCNRVMFYKVLGDLTIKKKIMRKKGFRQDIPTVTYLYGV